MKLIVRKRYFQGMGFSSLKSIVRKNRERLRVRVRVIFVARRGVEDDLFGCLSESV